MAVLVPAIYKPYALPTLVAWNCSFSTSATTGPLQHGVTFGGAAVFRSKLSKPTRRALSPTQ